jgi:hypothetical protein
MIVNQLESNLKLTPFVDFKDKRFLLPFEKLLPPLADDELSELREYIRARGRGFPATRRPAPAADQRTGPTADSWNGPPENAKGEFQSIRPFSVRRIALASTSAGRSDNATAYSTAECAP